jgi:hypothetical protein
VDAGGSLGFHLHFATAECGPAGIADCRWLDLDDLVEAGGHARGKLSDGVDWRLAGVLRLSPALGIGEAGDAADGERVQPLTLDVDEAVVAMRNVVPGVDLRVGQQRFAWGVSQGVVPLDVVNPPDLRDPTRFDRRLGTPAIAILAHHGIAALELVYTPVFRPARLPAGIDLLAGADELFDFADMGAGDVDVGSLETRTTVPDLRVGFAGAAARGSIAAPFADLAVVAWHGVDPIPQVGGEARILGYATDTGRVDVGVPVVYPFLTIVGAEARGAVVAEIVGSAEFAMVFPESEAVTASPAQLRALVDLGLLDAMPDPLPTTIIQDGRPFPRWVVGLDRVIGRFVLDGQWIHGLPTERQGPDVRDYGSAAVIVTVADPVQVRVFGVSDLEGYLVGGELAVLHADAATITLGTTQVDGPAGSALGRLHGASRVSIGVEAAF